MTMHRFITIERYNGRITAFAETENWQEELSDNVPSSPQDAVAEWVWQFAENKDQAISQHYAKHDLWTADSNADRPIQDTY